MNYKKWIEILTNYYEVDIDNCTMSNEAWIEQIAQAISNPTEFKLDAIEYKKVEGKDLMTLKKVMFVFRNENKKEQLKN
jgi:hypothetical protein|tara:strand:+ start:254 stop:490 length:237 start_codon:yes stop_codon:yes gene_type:complete